MTDTELIELLERVKRGEVSSAEAMSTLQSGPFAKTELPFAEPDHHRGVRVGLGEVIYGESKSAEQILNIAGHLSRDGQTVLITRLDGEKTASVKARFPGARINAVGRTSMVNPKQPKGADSGEPFVAVLAAGTADAYAAEEACEVCVAMGTAFEKFYDVGVAGLHRLLDKHQGIEGASALIVVAGMEGALPSVVGGLYGKPLFAVPTSVGYGASFGGIAALLAMLNSCAAGVAVVNIDNGFSAGYAACQVVRQIKRATRND
jgi:NCAIR mutase (PurE)-related protein